MIQRHHFIDAHIIYICIFYVCGRVAAVFVAKQHSGGAMMAADADDEAGQFSGTYKYIRRYIYIFTMTNIYIYMAYIYIYIT